MNAAWIDHDKKVRPYVRSHRVVGIGSFILKWALVLWLFVSARFAGLEAYLGEHIHSPFLVWVAYFGILSLGWSVASFPLDVMSQWIEHRFQLSRQTWGSWMVDKLKGLLVGGVLGFLVLGLLYFSVSTFGAHWWWVAATLLVLFSIVLAQLAPVILIPIFLKLKPMEPSPLKDRLLKLCQKFGVEVKDVYHLGLGEKTEKGNAAFVGLGRTKRIMIGDTLYEKFSPDEVEAVFAHELGHQVHNDLWKGIFLSTFFIYLTFWFSNELMTRFVSPELFLTVDRPAGMLIFFLVLGLVQIPLGPIQAAFSRFRERAADSFAQEKIGSGKLLADALEKLTYQNFGEFRPNALIEWWSFSHPAPWRRITLLRGV